MRILFCNKYNFRFSGTEAYLFSLMDLLRSAGHEVALFSMDWGRRSETQYPQYLVPRLDFKEAGRRPWTAPRRGAHMMYSLSARQQIRQAVRDFRPDVAHVRNIYHHLSPSILWELRSQNIPVLYQVNDFKLVCPSYNLVSRGHLCTRCHGGAFWHLLGESCYPGPRYASVLLAVEAYLQRTLRTYRKCISRIVAPSEFVREVLVGNGWDADKIDVLYHFQSVARQPVRASVHNAPILYFGRLSAEKGIDDLLRAMQSNRQIPLLIAGEGPGAPELNRLATALNLDNVTFLGKLVGERLDAAIASSQFTVFPSRAPEVLGKTILESYAHSKAVIASDLGSRRELVLAGETGLLYPTGEYQKLAKAIARLYAEPELAQEMGAAGRQLLLKRHTPDQHLSTLTGIYERVRRESVQKPALGRKGPSRPLRIAFIGGRGVISKYSGIESFYEEVGQRLVQRKHEVTVYCRNYFTPPVKSYSGMRIIRLPTIRTKHLDTFVHTLLSTLHATFSDVDIVHYHTLGPALFSFIPQLAGKKTVVTVQGLDWQRKKWGRAASLVLRLGEWAAGTFPNLTVVVSRALQEHYRSHNYKSTVLIPNGTVLREPEGADYLRSCNLEPDGYILFLGRLSPEKNCDLLIRAYEHLQTEVKLVLAGGSSYSDPYVDELKRHASERVRFLGWVSGRPLEQLLTNAMLFVLPSDLEGLSLSLLDAMGAGKCVLTSDVPENRELVDGVGFTFKAGDEQQLANCLAHLIASPALRLRAGQAGKDRIRQRFLWSIITEQIEEQYLNLLGWGQTFNAIGSRTSGSDSAAEEVA